MAVLLLAVLALGTVSGATTLVTEISNSTANEAHWMRGFDTPGVAVADFNGDGRRELVAHNENRWVYVLATDRPHVYAELTTPYPPNWGARALNDPAVADVDLDGRLDIVVVNSAAYVCVFEYDPLASTLSSFKFSQQWCRRASAYDGSGASADGGAWVEDVNGDGKAEIFMQTETRGLFAYRHDGTVLWSRGDSGGNAGPLVSDLNNDGRKEAIFFSDNGRVRSVDARTGSQRWVFNAQAYVWPASIPVAGAAADLDGANGWKEVVFMARDAEDSTNYKNNHLMLFVLRQDGSLRMRLSPSWANPLSYTHPVLVDVNGDGKRDIVAQDWNTIGHKPGNWERLGPANVFAFTGWGSLLWRVSLDNSWSNDDVGVADVDGDGKLEVVALGRNGGAGDGVWYLDARTGAKEAHVAVGPWTAFKGVVMADFDSTGDLEWAIPLHSSTKGGAFRVYDTGALCKVAYGGWQVRDPCGVVGTLTGALEPVTG